MLLRRDVERIISWPVTIAQSIVVIEQFSGTCDIEATIWSRVVSMKRRDLAVGTSSIMRDILKFYRKRTSCKCLKKMHVEARRASQKTGVCYGCLKEYERASLFVCSRCMIFQYCSRKCQLADWPDHESKCGNFVCAHQYRETSGRVGLCVDVTTGAL